ncbi:hypothetical protein J6590_100573 [Homalodisca vitripennis]|nr:hypothetical protein J6590_100573 [Homalodisca vitripennis]
MCRNKNKAVVTADKGSRVMELPVMITASSNNNDRPCEPWPPPSASRAAGHRASTENRDARDSGLCRSQKHSMPPCRLHFST